MQRNDMTYPKSHNIVLELRNWNLYHCWWECKVVQLLWKTVRQCLQKLSIELGCAPAIPLLGVYPREQKKILRFDPQWVFRLLVQCLYVAPQLLLLTYILSPSLLPSSLPTLSSFLFIDTEESWDLSCTSATY